MDTSSDPFVSERLVYRGYSSPEDDDFFYSIQSDPVSFINSCSMISRPATKEMVDIIRRSIIGDALLFVVICRLQYTGVPLPEEGPELSKQALKGLSLNRQVELGAAQLEPIGTIFLKAADSTMRHHRCTELGIDIKRGCQGQGYGNEAIRWALQWAFLQAGLHRVELTVLGWNERVKKTYERLGFREEGRKRQCLWKSGRWWDEVFMGILQEEWVALNDNGTDIPT